MATTVFPKKLGERLAAFRLKVHMTELHFSNERIRLSEKENPEQEEFLFQLEMLCNELDNVRISMDTIVDSYYPDLA